MEEIYRVHNVNQLDLERELNYFHNEGYRIMNIFQSKNIFIIVAIKTGLPKEE